MDPRLKLALKAKPFSLYYAVSQHIGYRNPQDYQLVLPLFSIAYFSTCVQFPVPRASQGLSVNTGVKKNFEIFQSMF